MPPPIGGRAPGFSACPTEQHGRKLPAKRSKTDSTNLIGRGGDSWTRGSLATVLTGAALLISRAIVFAAQDDGNSPLQSRQFIYQQVGGIEKLMVPADIADLPQPLLPDGTPDPLFQTTEVKRYLGKLLFHEPARATRIPEFGGILSHSGSASCGTCYLRETASKSGTLLNFATGAEARERRAPAARRPPAPGR